MAISGTESRFQNQKLLARQVNVAGVPVFPMGFPNLGTSYFVDAKLGSDSHGGTAWDDALLTMDAAFDKLKSGDVIYFVGKVREQLEAPAGVFDVSIIGAGNRPRHADDHTESAGKRGSSAATWLLPASGAVADTPCLRLNQQGWRLANFLMGADTNQVCVDLFRNGDESPASDERDSSHAEIIGMRFDGAGIGVRSNGGANWVRVLDSQFRGMTKAIGETTGAGVGTQHMWEIRNCRFTDNTNHVVVPLSMGVVMDNSFGKFTTKSLDLTGGDGYNQVRGNYFSGDYTTAAYVAAANDSWIGNFADDTAEDETEASGLTNAVPAA